MGKTRERGLSAAEVRKLPCGAKVIIREERRDTVWTVIKDGRYKKLFRQDRFTGMMYKMNICDRFKYLIEVAYK